MIPFGFDDDCVRYFIDGHCDELAIGLSHKLKTEIYSIEDETKDQDIILHYVVLYNEKFIDIRGIWDKENIIKEWSKPYNGETVKISKVDEDYTDIKLNCCYDVNTIAELIIIYINLLSS